MAVNPADSSSQKALGRFVNSPYEARPIDCFTGHNVELLLNTIRLPNL